MQNTSRIYKYVDVYLCVLLLTLTIWVDGYYSDSGSTASEGRSYYVVQKLRYGISAYNEISLLLFI